MPRAASGPRVCRRDLGQPTDEYRSYGAHDGSTLLCDLDSRGNPVVLYGSGGNGAFGAGNVPLPQTPMYAFDPQGTLVRRRPGAPCRAA